MAVAREPVVIADADPAWPSRFEAERARLEAAIGGQVVAIEHIGSTAVPGLAAKPVIDVMVGLRTIADGPAVIESLTATGYEYVPEFEAEFPDRRYFRRVVEGRRTAQVHVVERGDTAWWDRHIAFRDRLRASDEDRRAYEALKRDLAMRHAGDRAAYTDAKTAFIEAVVAGATRAEARPSTSFERIAGRYDETRGGLVRGRHHAGDLLPHLVPGPVLEVGVGTGAVALGLVERGCEVVGVDLAPAMLARAADRLGPRVAVADGVALPVREGSVADVCLVWVLQLVGDVRAVLTECARVLRPGGRVLVVSSRAQADDDEFVPALDLIDSLRPGQDRPEAIAAVVDATPLRVATVTRTTPSPFEESPNGLADLWESRGWSVLWDLDDATWAAVVQPAIDHLRGLPEPDRPRTRTGRHHLLVLERR